MKYLIHIFIVFAVLTRTGIAFGSYPTPQKCVDTFMLGLQNGNANKLASTPSTLKNALENCLTEGRTGYFWTVLGFHDKSLKRIREAKDFVPKNDKKTLKILKELKDNAVWRQSGQLYTQAFVVVSGLVFYIAHTSKRQDNLVEEFESFKETNNSDELTTLANNDKVILDKHNELASKNDSNNNGSDTDSSSNEKPKNFDELYDCFIDLYDDLESTKEGLTDLKKLLTEGMPKVLEKELEKFSLQMDTHISNINNDCSKFLIQNVIITTQVQNLDSKQANAMREIISLRNKIFNQDTIERKQDELRFRIVRLEDIEKEKKQN
jgi:hypothetical protein